MYKTLTIKEYERLTSEYDKVKYMCECGYRMIIPYNKNRALCDWCGKWVFKSKLDEFKYRFEENRKRIKNDK